MYDFFENHGITMEARVSLVLNVFMYVDDCIDISAFQRDNNRFSTLGEVVEALAENEKTIRDDFTRDEYDAADWGNKPRNEDNAAALKCEIAV
ncbi:MAG: hypothetical protein MJ071_08485 [Oscillospiraceae bacterium]|nr:hypothetical protein [Oscillospiraceae bacterium]